MRRTHTINHINKRKNILRNPLFLCSLACIFCSALAVALAKAQHIICLTASLCYFVIHIIYCMALGGSTNQPSLSGLHTSRHSRPHHFSLSLGVCYMMTWMNICTCSWPLCWANISFVQTASLQIHCCISLYSTAPIFSTTWLFAPRLKYSLLFTE